MRDWRTRRPLPGMRSSRRRRAHQPASSLHSPDKWALSWSAARPGAPTALLHGGQEAAQDADLILIGLAALKEPPQARHEMCAAFGAIAKVDLLEHRRPMLVEQREVRS